MKIIKDPAMKLILKLVAAIGALLLSLAGLKKIVHYARERFLSGLGLYLPPEEPIPKDLEEPCAIIRDHFRVIPFDYPCGTFGSFDLGSLSLLPPELARQADVAGGKKTVILGESHDFREFHDLRARFLFYLAGEHHFSTLVMEDRFSLTPFVNHFIFEFSTPAAERFAQKFLMPMIKTREEMDLIESIRVWNAKVAAGEIRGEAVRVGYSDLEHDFFTTLARVVDPFLCSRGIVVPPLMQGMTRFELANRLDFTERALQSVEALDSRPCEPLASVPAKAPQAQSVENQWTVEIPDFVTTGFIRAVVENLKSTLWAISYEFNYYRQKAIMRNLTDPMFLGDPFSKEKVIVSCGSIHGASNRVWPLDGSFLREGVFLNFDHPCVAGSVHSIQFIGFSRRLGSWTPPDSASMVPQGAAYQKSIARRIEAVRRRLAGPETQLSDRAPSILTSILLSLSRDHGGRPILIDSVDWDGLLEVLSGDRELLTYLLQCRERFSGFDKTIFIPSGSMTRARGIGETT